MISARHLEDVELTKYRILRDENAPSFGALRLILEIHRVADRYPKKVEHCSTTIHA